MTYNDSEPTSSHIRNTSQILVLSLGLTHKHSSITCSTSSLIGFQLSFNLSCIHCFQECFICCSSMSSCMKASKGTVWKTMYTRQTPRLHMSAGLGRNGVCARASGGKYVACPIKSVHKSGDPSSKIREKDTFS